MDDGRVVYVTIGIDGRPRVQADHPLDGAYRQLLADERRSPTREPQPFMCFYLGGKENNDTFWVNWESGRLQLNAPPEGLYYNHK